MPYTVVFTPEPDEQLAALYRYIADAASPEIAARYTDAIVSYCEGLGTLPNRGVLAH
jgi:toxin ParE1/3/4